MMLAYPAPIYFQRQVCGESSGIKGTFGCQLYRERQNGIGINAGARGITSRRSSVFPGWRTRRGLYRREPIMGFEV
jgi:hypothetical protein